MARLDFKTARMVVEYLRATENEIVIDTRGFAIAQLRPVDVGFIPRPSRWVKYGRRWPWATLWCWRLLASTWALGLASLFFLMEQWRFVRHLRAVVRPHDAATSARRIALGLSSRAADVIRPPAIASPDAAPDVWIAMPWAPLADPLPAGRSVDVFALLHPQDLMQARRLAEAAAAAMQRRRSPWVLQSYTAFRWFCVRIALEKIDGDFLMAEHYDRWAVLVDQVVARRRRQARGKGLATRTSLTLIQHGAVGGLMDQPNAPQQGLPLSYRLAGVDDLRVYDSASAEIFKNEILRAGADPSVAMFKPTITLRAGSATSYPRLLFVGHPFCGDFHAAVYSALCRKRPVMAYYKPHPVDGMPSSLKKIDWVIVRDRLFFPEVDLLVSYPSTLVHEYGLHGINACVHPINAGAADADLIAMRILAELLPYR
jgi:hypothetical protein